MSGCWRCPKVETATKGLCDLVIEDKGRTIPVYRFPREDKPTGVGHTIWLRLAAVDPEGWAAVKAFLKNSRTGPRENEPPRPFVVEDYVQLTDSDLCLPGQTSRMLAYNVATILVGWGVEQEIVDHVYETIKDEKARFARPAAEAVS